MAVQTHHPSNVLHLQRNEQEITPPGFRIADDQSSLILSNIGGHENLRKRVREIPAVTGVSQFPMEPQPSIQPLRPQKTIRLDQLLQQQQSSRQHRHHPAAALVSTGLQLASAVNQINPPRSSSTICRGFAGPVPRYSEELDQLLQAQGEKLRKELTDSQQAHCKQFLVLAEKSASKILHKKQTELDRLVQRTTELENQLEHLQTASFGWQSKALQEQAKANSIHAQIQQLVANAAAHCGESPVEDAGSACVGPDRDDRLLCRACRRRAVSVVVLPCRHLCVCEDCDVAGAAKTCPACDCVGSGSVRVFLS